MKILFIIIILLLMNAFFIISNNNLSMKDSTNTKEFMGLYFDWFKKLGSNTKTITGNIAKLNWAPEKE